MDGTQTYRETSLHASESGEAGFGGVTGTVALEQLPRLLHGRGRCRDGQRMGCAKDEDPASGVAMRTVSAVWEGHFSSARSGAPAVDLVQGLKTTRVILRGETVATRLFALISTL